MLDGSPGVILYKIKNDTLSNEMVHPLDLKLHKNIMGEIFSDVTLSYYILLKVFLYTNNFFFL